MAGKSEERKVVRRKGPSRAEKALDKAKKSKANLTKRMKEERNRARIVTVGVPTLAGLGRRLYAANAVKDMPESTAAERLAKADKREATRLPHVKVLGEAGTAGLVMGLMGFATKSQDAMNAGAALLGTEGYLRAAGYEVYDAEAAKLRGGSVGAGSEYDDDLAGYDDDDLEDDDEDIVAGSVDLGGYDYDEDDDESLDGLPFGDHPLDAQLQGMDDDELEDLIMRADSVLEAAQAA